MTWAAPGVNCAATLPCVRAAFGVYYELTARTTLMKIVEYLNRKPHTTLVLMGLVMVIYIGELDYVTGPMVALMDFYLIPIIFVAWFVGRWAGVFIALASALIWYGAKTLDPGSVVKPWLLLWNTIQRLGLFASVGLLTSEVAERKRVEQALRQSQEGLETRVRERTGELAHANEALQAEVAERTEAEKKLTLLNETLEQRVAERSAAAEQRARELARSESALRQQTSILQSILNSMGDGVIVADASANILLSNPAADRLIRAGLGTGDGGEQAEHYQTYLPQTLTAGASNEHPLLRAIRGETIDGAEVFLRPSDASGGLWLTVTGRPLIDEQGRIQGGVVVYTDISSRKLMEKQISEISDREQRRIGQDLHDNLCQHMVSIAFAAELLRDKLERKALAEAAQAETIAEMVNQGISQARNLARGLYPVRLEVDGLTSALEELAATTQTRNSIACHFACDEQVLIHDEVAGNNLYRIAQEAVNNAIKHGRGKNISIGLGAVEDEVTLTIKDDGIGFPETLDASSGMGLHIMNYRAKMIGAFLDIRRGAGGGTIVICSFHNQTEQKNEPLLAHKT
jgi:signal transduction histidine kinase